MSKKHHHFMSTVKVGIKGQIVIPKEIRDMFKIEPGDSLIIMADVKRGIAIQKADILEALANKIFAGQGEEVLPEENEESRNTYATAIKHSLEQDPRE